MRSHNLHELVLSASARWKKAIAFRHIYGGKVRHIAYNDLPRLTYLFAAAFAARGLQPGDRLILCADNSPEWVIACLGAFRLGLVVVPVDARSRQSDLESIAEKVRPSLFLLGRSQQQLLSPCLDESKVAVLDELLNAVPSDVHQRPRLEFKPVSANAPALIVFTSGTSGASKGVVLTHQNIMSNVATIVQRYDLDETDRLLSVLPLSHMFEFTTGLIGPMVKGATIVYARLKGPEHLKELLKIEKISVLVGVPAVFQNILKAVQNKIAQLPGAVRVPTMMAQKVVSAGNGIRGARTISRFLMSAIHNELGGRIKFWAVGGGPVPAELVDGFASIGIPLLAGYGLTEASPVVAANTRRGNRAGSAGRPLSNVEVTIDHSWAIVDEEAENSVDSEDGEILVRGPSVMMGYFEDDAATDAVIKDGWLHTGDIGRLDSDGYLFVTGRIKSTIVTAGGYNIHPEELELILEMSPAIKEASVFGLPGPGGEQAYALIVPSAEASDRLSDHRFFQEEIAKCLADVAEYKRLAGFQVYDGSLPRTRSGKIQRPKAAELYQSLQEQKDGAAGSVSEWDADGQAVCDAIMSVLDPSTSGKTSSGIAGCHSLVGDLFIDSFARLELAVRLEESLGCAISDDAVNDAQTVDDLVALVKSAKKSSLNGSEAAGKANSLKHNLQYDLVSESYKALDSDGFDMTSRLSAAIEPWPFAARPALPERRAELFYLDAARRSLVLGLKILLRTYNRLEIEGADRLLLDPPYIVVANHTSHVDTAAIFASFPPSLLPFVHPVAAADTFFADQLSSLFAAHLLNALPFDRYGDFETSLDECEAVLRRGEILILFPEGTRSTDGVPGIFRTGAARLAAAVGCPIVPAYIDGAREIMPKHAMLPKPGQLKVRYGVPIYPTPEASLKDVQELTLRLQEAVFGLGNPSS